MPATHLDINRIANTISTLAPELRADLTEAINVWFVTYEGGSDDWHIAHELRATRLAMLREALDPQYPPYEPDPRD